jgi:NAD(P)-dependent dehydrogenase (short-subunit alcohol dehydrogenase family)
MVSLALDRQIVVGRSASDCYRYLADFSTCEQWDPGVRRAEKHTFGAPREGSRFSLELGVLGRSVVADYELREARPCRHLLMSGSGAGFTAVDRMEFSALGPQRTRIRYRADMTLDAAPAALRPLVRLWGSRLAASAMRGLVRALESDGAESPGLVARAAERLVVPGLAQYTRRGYRGLRSRGLSRRLEGKTVAITGATAGLGLATAQLLGRLGATLVLVGRGAERLAAAEHAVRDFAGDIEMRTYAAELSSLDDTRRLADRILAEEPAIDVWINNAGALFNERALTPEGHERTLATNLLSPALLSLALRPVLRRRAGRIINVVSGGLYAQGVRLDDLDFAFEPYNGARAYARAKRALLALTQRWSRAPGGAGIRWQAVHPGWAATPGVARSLPAFDRALGPWLRDARMGADTIAWLASHPAIDDPRHQGTFWFDRAPRPIALLPNTAVRGARLALLETEVLRRIGASFPQPIAP